MSAGTAPRLATIPPHLPFLDTVARRWLEAGEDPADGLILLPTRRAARALAEAFLRVTGGRPMLLPRITALGAIDETPLALAGALDVPPAVESFTRLAALARLVMRLPRDRGGAEAADRAWALADELARLMDEAEQQEVALPEALARAAEGAYAAHWEATLHFLRIVTEAWPAWLAENGLTNPVARQRALLDAQAARWAEAPLAGRVWAAGVSGAIPAVARLLRVIAHLPAGMVVLPWLDPALAGVALEETHPQHGPLTLLAALRARPGDVAVWDGAAHGPPGRAAMLADALLPAPLLHLWRERPAGDAGGLHRLDAADQQEEAAAIAMILRDALETPGAQAALVTPDRGLAGRVSAELLRWGIVADDSAGENLVDTPPAVFLRLLARAWVEQLGPAPLLAWLKHPFAALGLAPAACRELARTLEVAALRGPRPAPGITGLRLAAAAHEAALGLVERVRVCLSPLTDFAAPQRYAPAAMLRALLEAAEAGAATDAVSGAARLWAGEEGQALAALLIAALPALEGLPAQDPAVMPGLLDALLSGAVVRSRRALRGRAERTEHPRVFIWGLLEARLQAVDVAVLGGLTEGSWPPATDPGPWMSRPMRARAGLPGADRRIGEAAHDFVLAACSAPVAVLSAPRRRDGAPAVPSRWLARLDARLGAGAGLPRHSASSWVGLLDQPAEGRASPAPTPLPRPPRALRPRRFSVSDIGRLIADPYAIYAKRILRLRALDPLEQETDALDYGTLVHRGIETFLRAHLPDFPADAARELREAMRAALFKLAPRPSVMAWWSPRLERIADWVAAEEARRRGAGAPLGVLFESEGRLVTGDFEITAKADRIEQRPDGTLSVLDYKTGAPPGRKDLLNGTAPQLPLEAAMAEAGAFAGVSGRVAELIYWRLSGGREPGEVFAPLSKPDEMAALIARTPDLVLALLQQFDDEAYPYAPRPHPGREARGNEYAQLSRVAETDAAGPE